MVRATRSAASVEVKKVHNLFNSATSFNTCWSTEFTDLSRRGQRWWFRKIMVNETITVGFVANANDGRGTISLLLQCLSTTFLCVYTALHFDIPVRPLSKWIVLIRKIIFTIMAIAPEFIPYNAFNDWYWARLLRILWNASINSELSMKQVHYLLSGGVQISASTEHHDRVLEVELLVFINQFGLAPSHSSKRHPDFQEFWDTVIAKLLPDRDLDDKSKSDIVGKAITCL